MLLNQLANVLTFERIGDDRYVAVFGDKTATSAERASDDRLFDWPGAGDTAPHRIRRGRPSSRRLMQRADGYRMTMVNGIEIQRDGITTGSLPGRLVRGPVRRRSSERAHV